MSLKLRFQPVSYSWVALHPEAKGVIQFVGGAFFGTFAPMLFYRYLLQRLFEEKYTIILLPFNFSFNHYVESGFLIREQYEITPELVRRAKLAGYKYETYLDDTNFSWVGHSIGCKYIALLEGFSALPQEHKELEEFIRKLVLETTKTSDPVANDRKIKSILQNLEILINDLKQKRIQAEKLIQYYLTGRNINLESNFKSTFKSIFIKGQTSVLLAPVNSGTDSAIPKPLAKIIDAFGVGVKPSPDETFALIKNGKLFNIMGLVRFNLDTIAKSTYDWFVNVLHKPPQNLLKHIEGGHLRPLGIKLGNSFVLNFPDNLKIPLIESTQRRNKEFDSIVVQLLKDLEKER